MDKILISLKDEYKKATHPQIKLWLLNSIRCLSRAIEQDKTNLKKEKQALDKEKKEQDKVKKEALAEIEKKRYRIK